MEAVATVMALQTGMVRLRCGVVFACAGGTRACGVPCGSTDAPYLPQLHPNPNLKNPDPAVDLKIVVGATAQKHAVRCAATRRIWPRVLRLRSSVSSASRAVCSRRPRARVVTQVDVALSNSFGFGGHNSCILFTGFKP